MLAFLSLAIAAAARAPDLPPRRSGVQPPTDPRTTPTMGASSRPIPVERCSDPERIPERTQRRRARKAAKAGGAGSSS